MSLYHDKEVRKYLVNRYASQLQSRGLGAESLPDDFDLLQEGIIDSLGIMELVTDVESHFGHPVDFEELDAEKMTVVGPLVLHITRKLMEAKAGNVTEANKLSEMPTALISLKGNTLAVWLALDDRSIRKGLMGIEAGELSPLADGTERGMLFAFPVAQLLSFWMFKTRIPLDITYLDAEGKVINWYSAQPFETRLLYPSARPAKYVLEVNANLLQRWGVQPGDSVSLPVLPGSALMKA